MAYAGAVWLAVQEDLYRGVCREPAPKVLTTTTGSSSNNTEPRDTHQLRRGSVSRLEIFDDYFLSQCFHFPRQCLTFIVDCIKARMKKDVFRPNGDATLIEAMTLAALYYYAHGFLSRKIADALGLDYASASDAINTVSKVLEDMSPDFITFPRTYDDRMGVAQGFKCISGIPNVVGVLGWLHVQVNPTSNEANLFLNTRGYHSVMVQIISDIDGNLLSVEQCRPGGTKEQEVWESSNIYQEFNRLQHGQTWVLGGKGLCKAKHVLSPVESSRIETNAARRFNTAHSEVWKSIQHILGCLKTCFRCLHTLGAARVGNLKPVARIVTACCVLHNISKKFSVPLPSNLVLEHLPPDLETRQEEHGKFVDTEEAVEDMIEMCFGNSGDEEEQKEIRNIKDIKKKHQQNGASSKDYYSHKNLSKS
ncbi:putative nuclease HARBI1 [Clarias gariepinus]|uniref:putative nuclease HARBI1 n=1 Tax=Clarias gariepinus TaxID=13013 RepID=UPI00234C61A1|nr:putative nuclease HARBI1 [Clarias gariepinus]